MSGLLTGLITRPGKGVDFLFLINGYLRDEVGGVAKAVKKKIYAFTRPGDKAGQESAQSLGAVWAGGSDEMPPKQLDAAIIFAPVGALVPAALRALAKGGVVVCGGVSMPSLSFFSVVGSS